MTATDLLNKGYFARELPPPFQTIEFSNNIPQIESYWNQVYPKLTKNDREKFRESKWVIHSIPKVGFARRLLGLPNPYHQAILSKTISDNWTSIEEIFEKSSISNSKPVADKTGKRTLQSLNSFGEFMRQRIINSYDKLFEVRTDVSRYYPTIYTHIIPWVIHTKAIAKANRTDLGLFGNLLDKNLRESNSGQTLGIPIGPDTSLVIAEIIGCFLDEQVQNKFKTVESFRYIDDYYIYCDDQAMAEKVFKFLQGLFTEYQLDINEEKTRISKSPFPFESTWAIELGSFQFRKTPKGQQTDLERFISLAFRHAQDSPKDSVLKFAITCIKNIELFDESWQLYQSIILKIGLTEPATLSDVAQVLVSHKSKVETNKVKRTVELIIAQHIPKGHHYEVSWALWICKEIGFKLPNSIADLVFSSNDVISNLIALDLKSNGQINSEVSTANIESELTLESLMSENWLLTYEAISKGWIPIPKVNPIENNEYFKILFNLGIQFYDPERKITPIKVKSALVKDEKTPFKTIDQIEFITAQAGTAKKNNLSEQIISAFDY